MSIITDPTRRARTLARITAAGFADGWREPYDLSTSTNVEYLGGTTGDDEILDRAINLGQLARGGLRSQVWREGMWPVAWNGNAQ